MGQWDEGAILAPSQQVDDVADAEAPRRAACRARLTARRSIVPYEIIRHLRIEAGWRRCEVHVPFVELRLCSFEDEPVIRTIESEDRLFTEVQSLGKEINRRTVCT